MIALLVIGFVLLALWQIPSLMRKGWWKEIIYFAILWLIGLILSIMPLMGVRIPRISTIINKLLVGFFGI